MPKVDPKKYVSLTFAVSVAGVPVVLEKATVPLLSPEQLAGLSDEALFGFVKTGTLKLIPQMGFRNPLGLRNAFKSLHKIRSSVEPKERVEKQCSECGRTVSVVTGVPFRICSVCFNKE